MKSRAEKQSHLDTERTRWRRTQPVDCDPGDSSGDASNSSVESGAAGPPARTGQRQWPRVHSSENVTHSVFPVSCPAGHSPGTGIYPLGSCFLRPVIIYHVTLDRFHCLVSLWLPSWLQGLTWWPIGCQQLCRQAWGCPCLGALLFSLIIPTSASVESSQACLLIHFLWPPSRSSAPPLLRSFTTWPPRLWS